MLTAKVDQSDWLFGFAHGWIAALAEHPRVGAVDVLCLERGVYNLPGNVTVTSMGKEEGKNRLRELWRGQRALTRLVPQADVIFTHMIPRYTWLAAPWALLYGVPQVLWYTHQSVTWELRLAHHLAQRIVTAAPASYPLPDDRVSAIGHGIDLTHFYPGEPDQRDTRLITAVGRLSPVKHYDVLLRALAELHQQPRYHDIRLILAGGTTPQAPHHEDQLRQLRHDLGLVAHVEFAGPLPHREVADLFRRAGLAVSLSGTGGIDKVVLEALACGVPTLVHGSVYRPLFEQEEDVLLWCPSLDPVEIAAHIDRLLSLPQADRAALGQGLAARTRQRHGIPALIDRLVDVFAGVADE